MSIDIENPGADAAELATALRSASVKIQEITSSPSFPGPDIDGTVDLVHITSSGSGGVEYVNLRVPHSDIVNGWSNAPQTNRPIIIRLLTQTDPNDIVQVNSESGSTLNTFSSLADTVAGQVTYSEVSLRYEEAAVAFVWRYDWWYFEPTLTDFDFHAVKSDGYSTLGPSVIASSSTSPFTVTVAGAQNTGTGRGGGVEITPGLGPIGYGYLRIDNLPSSDPNVIGCVWNSSGQLVMSGFTPSSGAFVTTQTVATPNATVPVSCFIASGATNVDALFAPAGNGAILSSIPDNSTLGGNKRGLYTIDLQRDRLIASDVATGDYSCVLNGIGNSTHNLGFAGGYNCQAYGIPSFAYGDSLRVNGDDSAAFGLANVVSGQSSFAAGSGNIVSGDYSEATGYANLASGFYSRAGGRLSSTRGIHGARSYATVSFNAVPGRAQQTDVILVGVTSLAINTHPTVMLSADNSTIGSLTRQLSLQPFSSIAFNGKIIARSVTQGATATSDFPNNPTDGSTLTLNDRTYTFQTTLTDVDGNVQIAGSVTDTLANLVKALSLAGVAGADYAASMTANADILANQFGITLVFWTTARGTATNSYPFTTTVTGAEPSGATFSGGSNGGLSSFWKFEGLIVQGEDASTTSLVGSVTKTLVAQDAGASSWDVTLSADTSVGFLRIDGTGPANVPIHWIAHISAVELADDIAFN